MTTDLTPAASPFDALRRTDEHGNEFWSARDLMPHMDYERWERFADAIERAKAACTNSGHDAEHHFRGAAKVIKGGRWGEQTVADYSLTRFAAYLLAMNGDPRKAAIASAQTYFAQQARFAETVQQQTPQFAVPQSMSEALRLAATAWEEKEAAQAALAVAEVKATAWEAAVDDDALILPKAAAKTISNAAGVDLSPVKINPLAKALGWVHKVGGAWYVNEPARRAGLVVQKFHDRPQGAPDSDRAKVKYPQVYYTRAGVEKLIAHLTADPNQLALVGA